MRGTSPVLIEKCRLEPFSLLRWIDGGEKVFAGGQTAKLIFPVLIGPRGHDLSRLWAPERRIGREGQHREFGDWLIAIVGERPVHLRKLVGEDDGQSRERLAAADVQRCIDDLA